MRRWRSARSSRAACPWAWVRPRAPARLDQHILPNDSMGSLPMGLGAPRRACMSQRELSKNNMGACPSGAAAWGSWGIPEPRQHV